jgi:hypothetical protein
MVTTKRETIEEKVRYLLWAKSAGHCQFGGCNISLFRDGLTKIEMNIGEVAHIIGQGKKGPRSYSELLFDKKYVNDISNLMLLCPIHHKEIDAFTDNFDQDLLREMKEKHERFIELATQNIYEKQTHVITYVGRIGSSQSQISLTDVNNALFPAYFPAEIPLIELGMIGNMVMDNEKDFWDQQIKNLKQQFNFWVLPLLENNRGVNHYSIFAYAPIPLLILLGALISDIYPVQVYQLKKEPPTWSWQITPKNFDYIIEEPDKKCKRVALNLSLSADIDNRRITNVIGNDDISIWKMKVNDCEFPKNDHLRSPEQLILFSIYFRKMLNNIRLSQPEVTEIHLFPAVPMSCAVEIGRLRQQKADLSFVVYDQNNKNDGFTPVLRID